VTAVVALLGCFGVDSGPMREALPTTFAKYRTAANKASHRVQVSAILAATVSRAY
jgi:hypothetical protein